MKRNKGFTLIELLVVVAIIALLISILLPSLGRARELAKQAVCRSNLRGIGQAMTIYSNDNREFYPVAPSPAATGGVGSQSLPVQYIGNLGFNQTTQPTSLSSGAPVHPSRSLFLLIIGGQSTPQQFVCPSASETADDLRNRLNATTVSAAQPGFTRFDFLGYGNLSYGYIMPYGNNARPTTNLDTRMPLGADKGPYFAAGQTDANTRWQRDAVAAQPIIPPAFAADLPTALRGSNDQWRPYNSRNHSGEGQVVLYVDGHADFVRRPIEGVNNDNIYNYYTNDNNQLESLTGRAGGIQANDTGGPRNDTDSFIVP